jgi:hypothetical protein
VRTVREGSLMQFAQPRRYRYRHFVASQNECLSHGAKVAAVRTQHRKIEVGAAWFKADGGTPTLTRCARIVQRSAAPQCTAD